ncbi:MAG: radical SAM protein [Pseudomonadota bacterium]
MTKSKKELINYLKDRPIVIWGARMTGMGFSRFSHSVQLKVLNFVDSDPALENKNVNGIKVLNPSSLPSLKEKYPNLAIVIAVSIKESEIISLLAEMNLNANDFVLYSDYCESFYTIDVMGTCNLKCPSCAHSLPGVNDTKKVMSFDDFKQVIDKIQRENELVTHVSLYSWGEPLLHRQLPKIIKYLHDQNIAAAISSNLSIIDAKQIDAVIYASPEYLKVSLSGFYPAAYNKTHTGGDINLVKSNLYRIKFLIEKYNAKTFVDVNYHLYTNNNGKNLEKMKELCNELGFSLSVTHSLVMPLERCLDHCDGIKNSQTEDLSKLLLVNIDEGIEATKNQHIKECPFRENQININWDLTVPVCCTVFDYEGTIVADNYLKSSLAQINKNKSTSKVCKKCMGYGLPAYNMGLNKKAWNEISATKISLDLQ